MFLSRVLSFVIVVILLLALAVTGVAYYLCGTPQGLRRLTAFALERFVQADGKAVGSVEGTLLSAAVFKNVELRNLARCPAGTTLRIQLVTVTLHGLDIKDADIEIRNARLKFPDSENIVLDGSAKARLLNVSVFSPVVDVEEIATFIDHPKLRHYEGSIRNIDVKIRGRITRLSIAGTFLVETLQRPRLKIADAPGQIALELINPGRRMQVHGQAALERAQVEARKTRLTLKPSRIFFSGRTLKEAALAVEGFSRIDDIYISLAVRGTIDKPQLLLSSDSGLTQDELMLMLATGRQWKGLAALKEGQMTVDVVKDLFGYLFASESNDGLLDKYGISDVTITLEDDRRGVGLTKELTEQTDLEYSVEQKGAQTGDPSMAQTIGADYRVTDQLSVTVERQQEIANGLNPNHPSAADDRLLMKYKTKF